MQIDESKLNDLISIIVESPVKVSEVVLGSASATTISYYYVIKLDNGQYYKLNFSDHYSFENNHDEHIDDLLDEHFKIDNHDFYLDADDFKLALNDLDLSVGTGIADTYDEFTGESFINSDCYYGLIPLEKKYNANEVKNLLYKSCIPMAFVNDCYIVDSVQLSADNLVLTVDFTDEQHKAHLTKEFVDYMPEVAVDNSSIALIKYLEDDELMDEHQARRAFYADDSKYSCISAAEYRDNLYNNLGLDNDYDAITDAKSKSLASLLADNEDIKTINNKDYVVINVDC